ncbi:MAG TPA: nucleoside deaminase [Isosphaeraceae bacterium]|nr:nucleoside deaminase [Isosphaeraceae bacterium]
MTDEQGMQHAIEACRRGIEEGQSPFGAAIVKQDRVLVAVHNTVWADTDPSAHAEVNAIRAACRSLNSISLEGCTLYSTCEPCPMCLAASHWAKIDRIVFGASVADARAAGFSEMRISIESMVAQSGSHLILHRGVRLTECASLFEEWKKANRSETY